jgi:hypothetical protein
MRTGKLNESSHLRLKLLRSIASFALAYTSVLFTMQFTTFLASLTLGATVLAAPTATATKGWLVAQNKCDFDLYLWDVAEKTDGPHTLSHSGGTWSGQLHTNSTGPAIKVSPNIDALGTPNYPTLILGYSLSRANDIYYDVSSAYGTDTLFKDKKVYVHGSDGLSPPLEAISWYGTQGNPSGTKRYIGDYTDLFLELCANFP